VRSTLPFRALAAGAPTGHAHDITVYGSNESVFYKNGQPFVSDRGRELGMTNRISHVAG
jgi:hypothetical protein